MAQTFDLGKVVGPQGPKGDTGAKGADGITPTIGANGNWFLGSTDTGKPARGATGAKGDTGAAGAAGATGPQGPAGADGKTPTFSIDENGHLIATFE